MKHPRGFTLMELTIVATIMTVVAGLVIIRWGTFSARQQAVATARQLGNTLSQYRERAQSERSLYALAQDLDNNRYSIGTRRLFKVLNPLKTQHWPSLYASEKSIRTIRHFRRLY